MILYDSNPREGTGLGKFDGGRDLSQEEEIFLSFNRAKSDSLKRINYEIKILQDELNLVTDMIPNNI